MLTLSAEDWISSKENISIIKYLTSSKEEQHAHEFIEMEYVFSGSGVQIVNGETYYVKRGDMVFLNLGNTHGFMPDNQLGLVNIMFKPAFFCAGPSNQDNAFDILSMISFKEFSGVKLSPHIKLTVKKLLYVEGIIEAMLKEFSVKNTGYLTVIKGYATILLAEIFRSLKKEENTFKNEYACKLPPGILKFVENNFDKKITLNRLAGEYFYTPAYFSRIFKECFGKTLTEYIGEKRMIAAMKMLLETDKSVEEIMSSVGYNDKKRFYKLFKDYTGQTPCSYRNRIGSLDRKDKAVKI